jgi:hypothetical protein
MPQGTITGILDVAGGRGGGIADFAFDSTQEACAVALERSGAVMSVDTEQFQVSGVAETAETLSQIALLDDGRFIARASDGPRIIMSSF